MKKDEGVGLSFERVVFFTDAVFAIVITLLVLEIKVPHLDSFSESELRTALMKMIPKFSGFLASFFIIGLMWFEHHRIFQYISRYDAGLIWRNLVFLLSISFIPFPTALTSEYFWSGTAFVFYASSFAFAGLAKLWIWNYAASKGGLLIPEIAESTVLRISRRSWAVPLGSMIAVALSFVSIFIAPFGFALIPLIARLLSPPEKPESVSESEPKSVSESESE
jgi:uncharacterized membrane protein